jgi:2-dehydropantoate 2-reductase
VNEACIVPVVVDLPSSSAAPGQIVQRAPARLTVTDDSNGRAFAGLFDGTGIECVLSDDLVSVAWRKLCSNVVGGALAALAGKPLSEISNPRRQDLARRLAHECAAVARAEGARLSDLEAEAIADSLLSAAAGGAPSILQDRLRGTPLEWEARNGAVVRLGARHAIDAPLNARACELLAAAHREPNRDLLAELADHG